MSPELILGAGVVALLIVGTGVVSLLTSWDRAEEGPTFTETDSFRRHCNECGQCQVQSGGEWHRVGPTFDINCRCHSE